MIGESTWNVGVVIPARNEESSIVRCTSSVLAACAASSRCGNEWIVVVADACTDRTVHLARTVLRGHGEVIECHVHSPGAARKVGAEAVLEHFKESCQRRVWLANTDADSYVPETWIETHLEHADADAEGLAGIVCLDPSDLQQDVQDLYERSYRTFADGTHPHVHGANLGVRADAYLEVGGWSDLTVAEDHCLWRRLTLGGCRVTSSVSCVVHTSGRLVGRASGGFADTLRRELAARV